jgi:hypothetical protein
MVGVVDKVEIVGVDVKLGGAVVASLRCVEGEVIVDKIEGCWSSSSGNLVCFYWGFVGREFFVVGNLLVIVLRWVFYVVLFLTCFG